MSAESDDDVVDEDHAQPALPTAVDDGRPMELTEYGFQPKAAKWLLEFYLYCRKCKRKTQMRLTELGGVLAAPKGCHCVKTSWAIVSPGLYQYAQRHGLTLPRVALRKVEDEPGPDGNDQGRS